MWKREESSRSTSVPITEASPPSMLPDRLDLTREEQQHMHEEPASIGKSIVISGQLSGSEDLMIEGHVDGKIELRNHVLTIGSNGRITAQVAAKAIIVFGHVTGNLTATEKVEIRESGSVEGDIVAPRVAIADGSTFRGSIDMQRKEQPGSTESAVDVLDRQARAPKLVAASMTDELVRV